MSKLLAVLMTLVFFTVPAAASILRIDLSKANQSKSPLKYSLKTTTSSGLVIVYAIDVGSFK